VGIVILLRRIMRREGVGAVVSCLLPLCVFFLAVAYENIIFDDLMGMLGSVFFALLAIEVIADIDQPKTGRLVVVGILCILSVMSSNAGFGMLVVVGIYLLLRHGWRSLTFLAVVPAAVAFVMWYFSYGLAGGSACPANSAPHYGIVPLFAASALEHSLDGLGAVKFSSVLIVAVGVFGFAEKCRSEGTAQRLAWSVAAVIGTAVLYLEIASARSCFGLAYARQPRYAYFGAVLLAPIVGYGLERLARRWSRGSLIIACALVLVVALNFNSMRLAEHLRQERTHAGAVQLAVARQDQEKGLKIPTPLSAVNPQVHQGELDDLVEHYGLDLPPIPARPPTGVPGE
jgi:hypothetical protein